MTRVFFSFIPIMKLQRLIELKFSQVCYFMHILSLTITKMSSVFKKDNFNPENVNFTKSQNSIHLGSVLDYHLKMSIVCSFNLLCKKIIVQWLCTTSWIELELFIQPTNLQLRKSFNTINIVVRDYATIAFHWLY